MTRQPAVCCVATESEFLSGAGRLGELGQRKHLLPREHWRQSDDDDEKVDDEEESVERQGHDAPLEGRSLTYISLTELRHERP